MKNLMMLAMVVLGTTVSANDCPNPMYKRFSTQHTGCKAASSTCQFLQTGVTAEDKAEILRVHNQLRQKIASGGEQAGHGFPSAANMMKMEWDAELQLVAQAHANQCNFAHDCNECRQTNDYSVGQNLGASYSTAGPRIPKNWTSIIQSFYDEIDLAPKSIVSSFKSGGGYGHFSQVVWADSWAIGCGYAAYKSSQNPGFPVEQLFTCNYGPAGNTIRKAMYQPGSPASQCPPNTRRASDFNALCQAADANGPKSSEDKKKADSSIFFCNFADKSACGLKIQHNNNAFLTPTKSFKYLGFKVKPGQKVTIALPKSIQSSRGFCASINKRKGAADASKQANNQLKMQVIDSASGQKSELSLNGDSVAWVPYNIDLSSFTRNTDIQFTFAVPAGASEQVLDVKEIRISAGKCQ